MDLHTYNFSTHFPNGLQMSNLSLQIKSNVNISSNLVSAWKTGDTLNLKFDSNLTTSEKTELDNIIANYSSVSIINYIHVFNRVPDNKTIKTDSYKRLDMFIYEGSFSLGSIQKIFVVGQKSKANNYSIKIYDKTHHKTIAEKTLTNSDEEINELDNIMNIPTDRSIIEIMGKKSGNGQAALDLIAFHLI